VSPLHVAPRRSTDELVVALADRHLVVTTQRLLTAGVSANAVTRRVRDGRLTRLGRGVYRVGPAPGPWTTEAAALHACGSRAVLSHETAAALWAIRPRVGGPVQVTVAGGHRRGRDWIRVHHAPLARGDVRWRDGLRVTSPERTLIDLASTLAPDDLERAANEAQVLGLVARRGDAPVTRSELERRLLGLVRRIGLPAPRTNVLVAGHEVDAYWPAERLIVETDGHRAHLTRARFESDRARDAHLTALGYRVLRFTWRQLDTTPEIVAARLATALTRAAA
jgi:very-short-patch-repair endonuclease